MKLLFIFCLLPFAVQADSRVDNMVRHCESVMSNNNCRVERDKRDYPNSTIIIAGVGRISTESYLKIRNSGDQMCSIVREVCTKDFNNDDCKAARALWRQK